MDTRSFRWLHHAFYLATVTTTITAALTSVRGKSPALVPLALTGIPLVVLARVSPKSRFHPMLALTAAPAYAAALIFSRR